MNNHHVIRGLAGLALWLLSSLAWAAAPALKPYEEAVGAIVTELTQRKTEAFNRTIDAEVILDSAFDGLVLEAAWKTTMRDNLRPVITSQLGTKLVGQMPEGSYAKLLRVKQTSAGVRALVRMDYGDLGTGYLDLHLTRPADGRVRIVDWYDYSSGQLYTQSLRQIIAMVSPTPTVLGKVFDLVSSRKETTDAMSELVNLQKEKKYDQVVTRFLAMDEDIRKNRLLNVLAVQAATKSQDAKLYRKALAQLERNFSTDPTMAFLLIDFYFLEERPEKALSAVDQLQTSFGVDDAIVISIKSNVLAQQGKYGAAAAEAKRAIGIEPEYEGSYWSLLDALVQDKKYAQAVQAAQDLESRFGYDLGPENDALVKGYPAFVASQEYQRWRKAR